MAALVRVVNTGDKPFIDSFENREYTIGPGKEIVVDAEAPSLWLGFPGLRDDPNKAVFARTEQFDRLRLRYGYHAGLGHDESDWEALRPKIEVYTFDPEGPGQRVWMILDDPTGERSGGSPLVEHAPAGGESTTALQERLDRQEQELEALRRLLEARMGTAEEPEVLPEDKPRKVPVGARQRGASER